MTVVEDRTWRLRAQVAEYDPDQVKVVTRKRRAAPGVRGFCKRRLRFTDVVIPDGVKPRRIVTSDHNLLVNAGIAKILDQMIGATTAPYDAAHFRIGVGDDATAASASQTDLQAAAGSTHRQFKLVGSGPTRSSQTVTVVATFASGEAQFHWQEFCFDFGTADGTTVAAPMLNRKVADNGTKAASVWVFTGTVSIA